MWVTSTSASAPPTATGDARLRVEPSPRLPSTPAPPAVGAGIGDRAGVLPACRDVGDRLSRERPAHLHRQHAAAEDAVAELTLHPPAPAVGLAFGDRAGEEVAEADLRDGEVGEHAADPRRNAARLELVEGVAPAVDV